MLLLVVVVVEAGLVVVANYNVGGGGCLVVLLVSGGTVEVLAQLYTLNWSIGIINFVLFRCISRVMFFLVKFFGCCSLLFRPVIIVLK